MYQLALLIGITFLFLVLADNCVGNYSGFIFVAIKEAGCSIDKI